ncbi:MAG: hypothetical protein AAFV93_15050, partial [Chloroflexota bacterium]
NTPMEVALSHITEPPKPPRAHNPDIPADAQREILKALQKDAGKRHTTAMRFIDALKEAYNLHDTGTKTPLGRPIPPSKTSTKPMKDEVSTLKMWDDDVTMGAVEEKPSIKAVEASIPQPRPETIVQPKPDFSRSARAKTSNETENKGLPMPLIGGVVVLLVALGAIFFFTQFGDVSGDPANANMDLLYNEDFFAIKNTSLNATLDISALRINGESGESGRNFGTLLAPGECRFVRRSSAQDGNIPDSWNCDGTALRVESNTTLFWRAEDEADTSFDVINGNVISRTCDTAGRAVGNAGNNSCGVAWTTYTINEDETAE